MVCSVPPVAQRAFVAAPPRSRQQSASGEMDQFDSVREHAIWHCNCWLVQPEKHAWLGFGLTLTAGVDGSAPLATQDD